MLKLFLTGTYHWKIVRLSQMERFVLFVDRKKIKNWSSTVISEFMNLGNCFKGLLFRMFLYRIFMDRLRGAAMMLECWGKVMYWHKWLTIWLLPMVIHVLFMVTLHTHLVMVRSYLRTVVMQLQEIKLYSTKECLPSAFMLNEPLVKYCRYQKVYLQPVGNIMQLLFNSLTVIRVCTKVKQAVPSATSPSRIFTMLTLHWIHAFWIFKLQ